MTPARKHTNAVDDYARWVDDAFVEKFTHDKLAKLRVIPSDDSYGARAYEALKAFGYCAGNFTYFIDEQKPEDIVFAPPWHVCCGQSPGSQMDAEQLRLLRQVFRAGQVEELPMEAFTNAVDSASVCYAFPRSSVEREHEMVLISDGEVSCHALTHLVKWYWQEVSTSIPDRVLEAWAHALGLVSAESSGKLTRRFGEAASHLDVDPRQQQSRHAVRQLADAVIQRYIPSGPPGPPCGYNILGHTALRLAALPTPEMLCPFLSEHARQVRVTGAQATLDDVNVDRSVILFRLVAAEREGLEAFYLASHVGVSSALRALCSGAAGQEVWSFLRMLRRTVDVIAMRMLVGGIDRHRRDSHVYGSMMHGTATSVSGMQTGALCRAIYQHVPPISEDDLQPWITLDDKGRRTQLFRCMVRTLVGEDTALALVSLSDVVSDSGIIRPKYHNASPVRLTELIESARLFSDTWATSTSTGSGYYASVVLALDEHGTESAVDGHWVIPVQYLSSRVLHGVFVEVFRNASFHGQRGADGRVTVHVSLSPDPNGGVRCRFANAALSPEAVPTTRPGFLARLAAVCSSIPGVALDTDGAGEGQHVTILHLGCITVDSGHARTSVVTPLWVS